MKKLIYPSNKIKATTGTVDQMIDAFKTRITELESEDTVNLSTEVTVGYELHDSYGAPQAGAEITKFDNYRELIEYIESNPDVQDRIDRGYAYIAISTKK